MLRSSFRHLEPSLILFTMYDEATGRAAAAAAGFWPQNLAIRRMGHECSVLGNKKAKNV